VTPTADSPPESTVSRYEYRTEEHVIAVGWDNPLQTYFAQAWEREPKHDLLADEHAPVLWVGTERGEVPAIQDLSRHLRRYGGIPEKIIDQLLEDFERRHSPSPFQRQMASLVGAAAPPAGQGPPGGTHAAEGVGKPYVFRVEETVRFWDEVEVRAANLEAARELAFEQYYAGVECAGHEWVKSDKECIEAIPLRGHEGEVAQSPAEKGGEVMAWRPHEHLIAGELDNTRPGRVTGWMTFVGLDEPVTFDLAGDFHRDARGAKLLLFNPNAPKETADACRRMEGFATHQAGRVGDITAGLPPADYVDYPYVEWYSDRNGRVVLELEPGQVQVFGTPLDWQKEKPVSREAQARHMAEFLSGVAASFHPGPAAPKDAGAPAAPQAAEEGPAVDFRVTDRGTVWEFTAVSEPAKNLTRGDLGLEPWQWIRDGCFAIDHRPAARLVEQLREDGYRLAGPAFERTKAEGRAAPDGQAAAPPEAPRVSFGGFDCDIEFRQYPNGRTALTLAPRGDRESMFVATVNVPEVPLGPNEVLVKDYSENTGMLEALERAGVVRATGRTVTQGFVAIPVCELLTGPPALKENTKGEAMATEYQKNHRDLTKLLGGLDYVRIENGGYMPLVVERLSDGMISIAHYGEMNHDLMADPEVCLQVHGNEAIPRYFLNTYAGAEYATIPESFGDVPVLPREQKGLDAFTRDWFANLREQGFFDKAQEMHDARARAESGAVAEQQPRERGDNMRPSDRAGVVASVVLAGAAAAHQLKEAAPQAAAAIVEAAGELAGEGAADTKASDKKGGEAMTEQSREPNGNGGGKNRPIDKFSAGAVRVLVWDNGPGREPTLTVGRMYQDRASGEWRVAQSFRARDVQDLHESLDNAVRAILQCELGQKGKDQDVEREK
jgi:hypothetical protein